MDLKQLFIGFLTVRVKRFYLFIYLFIYLHTTIIMQ